ncbi:MAG: hypothetical protein QUS07_00505 [Methanothrix sp.]|nr:hypothetical protein [Methanothrix sp.]
MISSGGESECVVTPMISTSIPMSTTAKCTLMNMSMMPIINMSTIAATRWLDL